uniref:Uncharacterized protein n=1 Tax=Daphnia magna TaxID=35525 RepID=A0A0P6D749_9CRUS
MSLIMCLITHKLTRKATTYSILSCFCRFSFMLLRQHVLTCGAFSSSSSSPSSPETRIGMFLFELPCSFVCQRLFISFSLRPSCYGILLNFE